MSNTKLKLESIVRWLTIKRMTPIRISVIPPNFFIPFTNAGILIILGRDEFVALSVDVDDFNLRVVFQVLAQLGDIDVHRTSVEVVIINPDGLQGEVALQDFVGMRTEQGEQFILLGGQFCLLLADDQQLLLGVKSELADATPGLPWDTLL